MSITELDRAIGTLANVERTDADTRSFRSYQIEFHRRIAFAFTCIWVGLMGMALGIQPSRGGAAWGPVLNISVSVLIIFSYYISLALMTALSQDGVGPAWLLVWIPNVIFAALAWGLFRFVESERWMAVSQGVAHLLGRATAVLQRSVRPLITGGSN